jgi:hypothetical protein
MVPSCQLFIDDNTRAIELIPAATGGDGGVGTGSTGAGGVGTGDGTHPGGATGVTGPDGVVSHAHKIPTGLVGDGEAADAPPASPLPIAGLSQRVISDPTTATTPETERKSRAPKRRCVRGVREREGI